MGRQLLVRLFSRSSVHKWKCDFHSPRKCLFYVCVFYLPQKSGNFLMKGISSFMVWLTCPDKNDIAVSQSYFIIAGL